MKAEMKKVAKKEVKAHEAKMHKGGKGMAMKNGGPVKSGSKAAPAKKY